MTSRTIDQHELARTHGLPPVVRRRGRSTALLGIVLLAASTVTALATANTPPRFTTVNASAYVITEGQPVTVAGTFTDPDTTDAHAVLIYWHDGVTQDGDAEKIHLPAGETTFYATHTFPKVLAPTTVRVTLVDKQLPQGANDNRDGSGIDTRQIPIEVKPPDPAVRLQIIVKNVLVRDVGEQFNDGQVRMAMGLCRDSGPTPCEGGNALTVPYSFSAGPGNVVTINREMPGDHDPLTGDVTPLGGFPIYAGEHYALSIGMTEIDGIENEDLGEVRAPVDDEHGWGIGTFTTRSTHADGRPGDFDVTYEIRRMPLTNLLNRGIRLVESEGQQSFCTTVMNTGERSSRLIPVTIRADATLVRMAVLSPLGEGQAADVCVARSELPAQEHMLSFTIDEDRQIAEQSKTDNFYKWRIPALPGSGTEVIPVASPQAAASAAQAGPNTAKPDQGQPKPDQGQPKPDQGQPKPDQGAAKADLTVKAILLNGQAPDGKDDCRVGKNQVTVVVKNAGTGDAGSFRVRLSTDGDDVDATTDSLKAGQEREVKFEDVSLKKGQHTFKALADPEHAVSESRDNNNELKLNARCTDAA